MFSTIKNDKHKPINIFQYNESLVNYKQNTEFSSEPWMIIHCFSTRTLTEVRLAGHDKVAVEIGKKKLKWNTPITGECRMWSNGRIHTYTPSLGYICNLGE